MISACAIFVLGPWSMSGDIRHGSVTYTLGAVAFVETSQEWTFCSLIISVLCAAALVFAGSRMEFGKYYLLVRVVFAKTIRNRERTSLSGGKS